ncbi:MAG: hypothetical protein R3C08_01305 [Hyphomonas sp.]|nr:hypothetical protein [Hyphomonas sp.]HRX72812.1 hypothetical protein [Hyphomonas sp.]
MEFLLSVCLASAGGVAAGLSLARLTRGNMTGGLLGGMIGALAAHFAMNPAGADFLPGMAADILEGAAGGAVLGMVAAFLMKPKT